MNKTKDLWIIGFALFSLFFGAGNLLLPPLLGYNAGDKWFWVGLGFVLTAVFIPILGIYAHSKLQGTLYDFGIKVSPKFSFIYCILIYIIAIAIPSPRTAAATHEIAIFPNFGTSALATSIVYFGLVLVFVLNRSKLLTIIGKFLTPLIVLILLAVIGMSLYSSEFTYAISEIPNPTVIGLLEGYQTFDAIGAVVTGAVIIISVNEKFDYDVKEKKQLIKASGIIAGLGLFIIYIGLIAIGAFYSSEIQIDGSLSSDMQRANLLRSLSIVALGNLGNTILSVLMALACFTTAVGIVIGAADYFKGLFGNSKMAYQITAVVSCVLGVVVGQLDFNSIIVLAIPVLFLVYPVTIMLIILNAIPERFAQPLVFRYVIATTLLFSLPDAINFISPTAQLQRLMEYIPLGSERFGWVLPSFLILIVASSIQRKRKVN